MAEDHPEQMLSAGLLAVCKELLGRVRVLEEVIAAHPELSASYEEQARFRAAFEEDEYNRVTESLREVLAALEEGVDEDPEESD